VTAKKTYRRRIGTAFALVVAGGAVLGAPADAQQAGGEPVKIGVILALTGAGAGLGIPERNGAVLAEKIINSSGGIDGRPIQLIIEDDGSNPDGAISKANNLIYREKVSALIGSSQTASTVAVGGLSDPLKMPQVAMSGLGPAIERDRKYVLHIAPSQALNARAMLEYASSIGAKKLGALYDSGYGTVVYNELRKLSDAYGIAFVATEKFEISATDTTSQAAKIRAAQPDAIVVVGVTGVPIRSLRQLQMKQTIIAANGLASYEAVKSMGDAADNVVFPEFLVGEDPLPHQAEFVRLFHKEYGRFPKILEALGWDAVHVIRSAFKTAGAGAANEKLCEAIRSPFKGDMTDYDFSADDLNGIKLSNVVFSKLVGGQFTRLSFQAKEQ
jgi:branched-chain amino acid transport system substrate-binding protein